MSTHNICFSEALLMSTHNICFRAEIRKIFTRYPPLSRPVEGDLIQVSLSNHCQHVITDQAPFLKVN